MSETELIVIGNLNTDIVGHGLTRFPEPGEHIRGRELLIGPGGKSRNIAAMAGQLLPSNHVAMIGRTAEDEFNLWRQPLEALRKVGVNIDYVHILKKDETSKLPAVALISVDINGQSEIILLPGVSNDFDSQDVDAAQTVFQSVSNKEGFLALTLECPFDTALHAIQKASSLNIKIILDPGGLEPDTKIEELLKTGPYLIKPNEHEARMMTGIEVTDFESARAAAAKLKASGAQNVLITHGEHGAYLFGESGDEHMPTREINNSDVRDATGCGDQTTATLCAYLLNGSSLEDAAKTAVLAGTLQFHKAGIQPVTQKEIEAQL